MASDPRRPLVKRSRFAEFRKQRGVQPQVQIPPAAQRIYVRQKYAVVVPLGVMLRRTHLATTGLATCVGLTLYQEDCFGLLAHFDEENGATQDQARRSVLALLGRVAGRFGALARCTATICKPGGGDVTTRNLINGMLDALRAYGVAVGVPVYHGTDVYLDLATGEVSGSNNDDGMELVAYNTEDSYQRYVGECGGTPTPLPPLAGAAAAGGGAGAMGGPAGAVVMGVPAAAAAAGSPAGAAGGGAPSAAGSAAGSSSSGDSNGNG